MILITIGAVLFLSLLTVRYALYEVPAKYYAVFNLFGWRWRKEKEGLAFMFPFVEKTQLYSAELDRLEIIVIVTSKDMLGIKVTGSLESVPDFDLLFQYDLTKIQQKKALEDSIKDEIGVLAGLKEGEAFISEREVLRTIINCRLRLAIMPHRQNKYPEVKTAGGSIPPEKRIGFYKKYLKEIQKSLRREIFDPRRSHIEEAYGLDAKLYNLASVEYTEETKKAMEAKKNAEFLRKAAQEEILLAKSFQELEGLSGQEAVNASQVSLKRAEKKVISVEGLKGLNVNIGGGK
ncbi:MAG: hypothetical protein HYY86_01905 [Candidatus Harrisonbacteria bacterium]|nr:hypothetical protein [Candidatus Harrisonbacteria bacterium]